MICQGCGKPISDEAIVCSYCGCPVAGPPQSYDPAFAGVPNAEAIHEFASKKVAAGVCGILLGALGVHKFILGRTTAGIIMLATTLCSCTILWFPMHVIGLIEGIIYLTKSDREFYQIYGVEKKSWF
jgi:TM2 domain-containing membrane protein YozV